MKFIVGNWKSNGDVDKKDFMIKSLKSVKNNNQIVFKWIFGWGGV